MTIFEKIGIEYEERDGLLYPALSVTDEVIVLDSELRETQTTNYFSVL
ncbi:hypothetical protein ACTNA4_14175 [Bariatricus sp. HCP28S3_A7]